jgi:hypothetical protein
MATLTRAQVVDRALEAIGVKAAGQSSLTVDSDRAGESFDTVYYMLRKEGLAPFAISAVPEWAQSALIHMTAADIAPSYGIGGERLALVANMASKGRTDLATQVAATIAPIRTTTEFF